MKNLCVLSLAVALASAGSLVAGEKVKSGPKPGEPIGAFYVTKVAGAADDGVEEGKNLCYRCRNGSRPQVMVFTRSTDPIVVDLVKKLDVAVKQHEDSQLRTFVNLLGEDKDDLSASAKKLAAKSKTKNVPFVVPNEFENGPDNYGINAKAAVTIIVANSGEVTSTHAVAKAKDLKTDSVIKAIAKAVN